MKNLHKKAQQFLRTISKNDKVAIIHDTDADGICAAIIIAKTIQKLRGKKIELHLPLEREQYGITPFMQEQFKKHKITKLITLDFSLEQNLSLLKKLEKQMDILAIDHHKLYSDYKSKTIIYKPQLFTTIDPSKYCTAKLAYDLTSKITDIKEADWMAAAASIADVATTPWKKWLKKIFKKYKVKNKKNLFKTKLGQIGEIICSAEVYNKDLTKQCYEAFYKAKKPEDIINSKLAKYKIAIDKELNKHLKLFEKTTKGEPRVYELKSKYRINSPLSTILGIKYPHKTIIIINTTNKIITVSARRSDKKKAVNAILEEAIKGFKNSDAGGHAQASGAGFPKKYLRKFKERICKTTQK